MKDSLRQFIAELHKGDVGRIRIIEIDGILALTNSFVITDILQDEMHNL